jgi:hypothetical protein
LYAIYTQKARFAEKGGARKRRKSGEESYIYTAVRKIRRLGAYRGGSRATQPEFTHISEAQEILTNVRVLMILVNV